MILLLELCGYCCQIGYDVILLVFDIIFQLLSEPFHINFNLIVAQYLFSLILAHLLQSFYSSRLPLPKFLHNLTIVLLDLFLGNFDLTQQNILFFLSFITNIPLEFIERSKKKSFGFLSHNISFELLSVFLCDLFVAVVAA